MFYLEKYIRTSENKLTLYRKLILGSKTPCNKKIVAIRKELMIFQLFMNECCVTIEKLFKLNVGYLKDAL